MPNITIYVSAALAEAIRRHDIPISPTCQQALARKVRSRERQASEVFERKMAEARKHPAGRAS